MIPQLPIYLSVLFIATTLLTVYLFYRAAQRSNKVLIVLSSWLLLQAIVSLTGFYTYTEGFPPRFILLPVPMLLVIVLIFITQRGLALIDGLNLKTLTWLHTIRIPVELLLWALFVHHKIPQLMTFTGRNFDIIAGITAPLMALVCFPDVKKHRTLLIAWNIISLLLLINVVVNAALSFPFVFQQFGFEQPNVGLLYFPFVWLPCCVVPVVLFSHLAALRQLFLNRY